jgi:hypothetical protein
LNLLLNHQSVCCRKQIAERERLGFWDFIGKADILVYGFIMKILILILVLAISAQPLQAGFCDRDENQETPHQMDSHLMDQADDGSHDCCDSEQPESQQGCDNEMRCGFCSVSVSTLPNILKFKASWVNHYSPKLSTGVVLPSHSSPPFRPPIS